MRNAAAMPTRLPAACRATAYVAATANVPSNTLNTVAEKLSRSKAATNAQRSLAPAGLSRLTPVGRLSLGRSRHRPSAMASTMSIP